MRQGTRTARNRGASRERAYAVKGVFKYVWTYAKPRRMRKVWYESRVLRVEARSERLAKVGAHKAFKAESCASKWPAPDVASTEVTYIGISGLLDMTTELEQGELWWELLDERPRETPTESSCQAEAHVRSQMPDQDAR